MTVLAILAVADAATWHAATCPRSGRTYYYSDDRTLATTWQKPKELNSVVPVPAGAEGTEASFEELYEVPRPKRTPAAARRSTEHFARSRPVVAQITESIAPSAMIIGLGSACGFAVASLI